MWFNCLCTPITGSVCKHTKKAHAGIRLNRCNLTSRIRSMIDECETRRDALLLFPMIKASIKIPHDMSYLKGKAKS